MKIGIQELLLVFVVALFVFGPDKLPLYARKFGQALGQFRKFSDEATKDIRESIVEPLEEAQRPLREAMEPITDLEKTVKGNLNDIQKSFSDIGKPKKTPDSTASQTSEPPAAPGADLQNAYAQTDTSDTPVRDTTDAADTVSANI
ncbi:MAG: twin-arginine translocase TatA/TatE family subunit [Lachnospiraceae bacterium]|nr:twin-arginine translocase TatA/TatE family subunit [Lachnospiraceae bacterium]